MQNLYTLCDLGLLITKVLTDKEVNIGYGPISITFPSYYRTSEGSEDIHLKVLLLYFLNVFAIIVFSVLLEHEF